MRIATCLCSFVLLISTVALAQDWDCKSPTCEGHKAGYDWAWSRPVSERDCETAGEHYNSPSFAEGCKIAVVVKQRFALAREQLVPLFQAYALGQQVAQEGRVLPRDCEAIYETMSKSDTFATADMTLVAIGFKNGCLETANKQAKRIIKEDEKRAKAAAKQAKKQVQQQPKAKEQN